MSLHCKGIKSLQLKSFWWLLWTNSSSPMKSSTLITSLTDFFLFVFSFAWSYWWLLWFCSIFEFPPWWMPQWPAIKQVPTFTLSLSHLHPFLLTEFYEMNILSRTEYRANIHHTKQLHHSPCCCCQKTICQNSILRISAAALLKIFSMQSENERIWVTIQSTGIFFWVPLLSCNQDYSLSWY